MASTTVLTSFEQESMITFSPRSIWISRRSVSNPSLPLAPAVTSNPSTSSRVWRYLRMLGSSSIIKIFSFSATTSARAFNPSRIAVRLDFHWQQKLERPSAPRLTVHPDFSVMRLNQALGNRKPQPHPGRRRIDAHKVLENFLMKFRRNPHARIRHGNQHAVHLRTSRRASLSRQSDRRDAELPKVPLRPQYHRA